MYDDPVRMRQQEAAADRIAIHIPRCKIICSFRNPVERIYSAYKLWRHYTQTFDPLDVFLVKVPQIIEVTRYATHLPDYRTRFGDDRVLVLLNDDLRADPQAYLDRVCDFIGIARIAVAESPIAQRRINTFSAPPHNRRLARRARKLRDWLKSREAYGTIHLLGRAGFWRYCFEGGEEFAALSPEVEARLRDHFRSEVEAIEGVIGRDLSMWKTPRGAARVDTAMRA